MPGWNPIDRIRHALVDIAVSMVIILAVATDWTWARWIVIIYTPVMLVLKLIALLSSGALRSIKMERPPRALIHALYAVNVIALAVGRWWLPLAGWALIWLLSAIQERRTP